MRRETTNRVENDVGIDAEVFINRHIWHPDDLAPRDRLKLIRNRGRERSSRLTDDLRRVLDREPGAKIGPKGILADLVDERTACRA